MNYYVKFKYLDVKIIAKVRAWIARSLKLIFKVINFFKYFKTQSKFMSSPGENKDSILASNLIDKHQSLK